MTFEQRPNEMKEQAIWTSGGARSSRGNPGAKAGIEASLRWGLGRAGKLEGGVLWS